MTWRGVRAFLLRSTAYAGALIGRFLQTLGRKIRSSLVGRSFGWIVTLGIEGYPPDVQRRLKILNVIALLIGLATLNYAVNMAMTDFEMMKPVVYINLFLVIVCCLVPLAHRIHDIAGGLLIVGSEMIALMLFAAYFGRTGGTHVQYLVFAAATFVVFGLERVRLVIFVVTLALVMHLIIWFKFPRSAALLQVNDDVLNSLYTQGAITTFLLIAASVYYSFSLTERAKAETDQVLRNVLPDSIVERLKKADGRAIADSFPDASVLFADISGFVGLARRLGPQKTVELLNQIVAAFDALAVHHGVEKIKTIGDAYMVASGVPTHRPDHLAALAAMALDMLDTIKAVSEQTGHDLTIRIGLASGPIMAGVIGKNKFSYDVWGDPVNLASRLEGLGVPGRILVCERCHAVLDGLFPFVARGLIDIKGVGQQECWYLLRALPAQEDRAPVPALSV